jgi:hypothetical protein
MMNVCARLSERAILIALCNQPDRGRHTHDFGRSHATCKFDQCYRGFTDEIAFAVLNAAIPYCSHVCLASVVGA